MPRHWVIALVCLQALTAMADPGLMRPRKANAHGDLETGLGLFTAGSRRQEKHQLVGEIKTSKPKAQVLVFTAKWCGACQSLPAEYEKLRKVQWKVNPEESAHIRVVDADEFPQILEKYGVSALPTVLKVEDGKEVKRFGLLDAAQIAELYYGRL